MIIETKNLKKHYLTGTQTVKALNGIDLAVDKGEFISIMGPSGSGKTTLMNIIGCLDTPTEGNYNLNNKSVSQLNDDELAKIRKIQDKTKQTLEGLNTQTEAGLDSSSIQDIQESLDSFNAYRVQVNKSLIELRDRLNSLELKIQDTNNE